MNIDSSDVDTADNTLAGKMCTTHVDAMLPAAQTSTMHYYSHHTYILPSIP
jgi:hypothetical protein